MQKKHLYFYQAFLNHLVIHATHECTIFQAKKKNPVLIHYNLSQQHVITIIRLSFKISIYVRLHGLSPISGSLIEASRKNYNMHVFSILYSESCQ